MTSKQRENAIVKAFSIALVITIVLAGFGHAVLQLWNWLMPDLFGLPRIRYWQAVGLMSLSWILFGGLRGFGMIMPSRHRDGWASLTPVERERFRRGIAQMRGIETDVSARPRE